ncbi:hypothetical protein N825_34360 [Skermanella stibiiresistens SB22]|uniref:Uncharacterized protein n=1 Tax=Skermanella stibiiresistens SB22 TaxID=1385369 RepID=W9GSY6_9PROT|nr:hypothetical protein N825_34360 [Skermanella stibiiresistens SB22]
MGVAVYVIRLLDGLEALLRESVPAVGTLSKGSNAPLWNQRTTRQHKCQWAVLSG